MCVCLLARFVDSSRAPLIFDSISKKKGFLSVFVIEVIFPEPARLHEASPTSALRCVPKCYPSFSNSCEVVRNFVWVLQIVVNGLLVDAVWILVRKRHQYIQNGVFSK